MVQVMKHEWHQVDSQFLFDLTIDVLEEIYPDLSKKELKALLKEVANGEADLEQIFRDARDNDVEIEWDRDYDDWWTDRKGGYEVTFETVAK
jgi:hypothetical protein